MREIGVIIEADADYARAAVLRRSACGENCASCKGGCTPTQTIIKAKNTVGAKKGDRVILELTDKKALSAAALVYILPLAALFVGVIIGYAARLGEGLCALLGLCTMCVCFAVLHYTLGNSSRRFCAEIVKIMDNQAI